jgi:hypothetical protein
MLLFFNADRCVYFCEDILSFFSILSTFALLVCVSFIPPQKRRQREDHDDHDDDDDGRPGRLGFSSSFFFSRDFVDVFFAKEEERTNDVVVDAERGNEQRRGEEEDGKQE